jgi:hypothetical protein
MTHSWQLGGESEYLAMRQEKVPFAALGQWHLILVAARDIFHC